MSLDCRQEAQLRRLWGQADDDIKEDLVSEFDGRVPEIQEPTLAGSLFSNMDVISREQWIDLFLPSLTPIARQDLVKKLQA
jgi:hypothetical protein